MILWRISVFRDLSGMGGLKVDGRWHYAGQPVVYLAENAAAALLEVCAHTAANNVPPSFTLLRIEGPEVSVATISDSELPADWRISPQVTRELGTSWLRSNETVLLRVPNAIVPHTANFLFNPGHPEAASFRITESISYPFDMRIKQ